MIDYNASDNSMEADTTFIKGNYSKYQKFDMNGTYELKMKAEDWARNASDTSIVFTISLASFKVSCSPQSVQLKLGETQIHKITIENFDTTSSDLIGLNVYDTFDLTISVPKESDTCWKIKGLGTQRFILDKMEKISTTFSVSNICGAKQALKVSINACLIKLGVIIDRQSLGISESPEHVDDHPDDNESVSSSKYPTPWLCDEDSPVGVFASGWGEGLQYILGRYNIPVAIVKQDLTILNRPYMLLNALKVLLIGSAGLHEFSSSSDFRKGLEKFVSEGGVLVCLTAKNGNEFEALPGGKVRGFGWDEDQSCLQGSVSIKKYHQVLCGQTAANMTMNVDGYFTQWPEDAEILLQRNKNGMPAMITYPFGSGRVIATTIFPDWTYGHNQWTEQELLLIRDIVSWGIKARQLPEFSPDSTIQFSFDVINTSGVCAEKIIMETFEPNRTKIKEDTIPLSICAGDTQSVNISFDSIPANIGIWFTQYTLRSNSGGILERSELEPFFIISNPPAIIKSPDITFSITSDNENYAQGSNGIFTIHCFNNSELEKIVKFSYWFPRNYLMTHDSLNYGIYSGDMQLNPLQSSLSIPPYDSRTFTISVPLVTTDRLWVDLWDDKNNALGRETRGFYVYIPSCQISANFEKSEYKASDSVNFIVNLKNDQNCQYESDVKIRVINPENCMIWEKEYSITMMPNATVTQNEAFKIPENAHTGVYQILIEMVSNGKKIGSSSTHFMVPDAFIALNPVFSGALKEGTNAFSFIIENTGLSDIQNGIFDVNLLNPTGITCWNETREFTLEGSAVTSVEFVLPITALEFGTYQLVYQAHYNGIDSKKGRKFLQSYCLVSAETDKSSYHVREEVCIDAGITNNGRFYYDNILCILSYQGGILKQSTISINPGQNIHIPVCFTLPESMDAGTHLGSLSLSLPSGSSISKQFNITIPKAEISLSIEKNVYEAGETIPIFVENKGGTDATIQCSIEVKDNYDLALIKDEEIVSLFSGEKKALSTTIPSTAVSGDYLLSARTHGEAFMDASVLSKIISINGIMADINVKTDKQAYAEDDEKTAIANLILKQGAIENGSLNFQILKKEEERRHLEDTVWDSINTYDIKEMAAGSDFSVILKEDGTIIAWGGNDYGQINIPKNLPKIRSIAAGTYHTVALTEGGTVVAWGYNEYGQTDVPSGLIGVKAIAAGGYHTVALKEDGSLVAWGHNYSGQCNIPYGLNEIKGIAAGQYHTVALRENGSVVAWGSNWTGESTVPRGLSGVTAIAASGYFSVALKGDGTIIAWGDNRSGQIAIPPDLSGVVSIATTTASTIALKDDGTIKVFGEYSQIPPEIGKVTKIAAGSGHIIVLKEDGNLAAWGEGSSGQTNIPGEVMNIVKMAAGWGHVIVLKKDGSVLAWGGNSQGQTSIPSNLSGITQIAAGWGHSLICREDGSVLGWGNNDWGQASVLEGLTGVCAIAAGSWHTVALKQDGTVVAWGNNEYSQCNVPEGLSGVRAISTSYCHTLALKEDGTVVAWGNNEFGQLNIPPNLIGIKAITAGHNHSMALKEDGTVVAWGDNSYGQATVPLYLDGVKAIAAGGNFSVALKEDGTVIAWGNNDNGQTDVPSDLTDVEAISAGPTSSFALKANGRIVTWGNNSVVPELYKKHYLITTFDAGLHAQPLWRSVFCTGTTSAESAALFATRTADSPSKLVTMPWSEYSTVSGSSILTATGRYIGLKILLNPDDASNELPVFDSIFISYTGYKSIRDYRQTIFIDRTQSYSVQMDTLGACGSYLLRGTVQTSMGQVIAASEYPFHINEGPIFLTFNSNRKVYRPGDTIIITGVVFNTGAEPFSGISLNFMSNETNVFSKVIDLRNGGLYEFTFAMDAPQNAFMLRGSINGIEAAHYIDVQQPQLDVHIVAPDVVGRSPFSVFVTLVNTLAIDIKENINFAGVSQIIVIPARGSRTIQREFCCTTAMTLVVEISGDINKVFRKFIDFGEQVEIILSAQEIYPEGVITIPYSVINKGCLDSKVDLVFSMDNQTVLKQVFVESGSTFNAEMVYNQTAGTHSLTYSSFFGSGGVQYRVLKQDQISMHLALNRDVKPKVLILSDHYSDILIKSVLDSAHIDATLSENVFPYWNGTNPSLEGYDVVILPCGSYYWQDMPVQGQEALKKFVNDGGGFITAEYATLGQRYFNIFSNMEELLLYDPLQLGSGYGEQTFSTIGSHPILNDVPQSFTTTYYHSGNTGGLKPGATAIVSGSWMPAAVAVKEYGSGRIVQYAMKADNLAFLCWIDTTMRKLFTNSLKWAGNIPEDNTLQAEIIISNEGFNTFDGQLNSSTDFFAKTLDLQLASGETKKIKFNMNLASVWPGTYAFQSSVIESGRVLRRISQQFTVEGPAITLMELPTNTDFIAGQVVTMNFVIHNNGMNEGQAEIGLRINEIFEEKRTLWVAPGESEVSFTYQIPDDYPQGEYKAEVTFNGSVIEIPCTIEGADVSVAATFDRDYYNPGDTAVLRLTITNQKIFRYPVYTRAVCDGNEAREEFILDAEGTRESQLRFFVTENMSERIAFGVYHASGRAVHLNTMYIRVLKGPIVLLTDKSTYQQSDTVKVIVRSTVEGDLQVQTTTGFTDTIQVAGYHEFSFVLPEELTSGTNAIRYNLGENSGVCLFDVKGIAVTMTSVMLDKKEYEPIDSMHINFTITSDKQFAAVLKGWLVETNGTVSEFFELVPDIVIGETKVSVHRILSTEQSGTQRMIYGLYKAGTMLLLANGSCSFDVQPATIVSVVADRTLYDEGQPVLLTVSTKTCKPYYSVIEIMRDTNILSMKDAVPSGFGQTEFTLNDLKPGSYFLSAILRGGRGILSRKNLAIEIKDMSSPAVPTGLQLSVSGNTANLTWNSNIEPDCAGYFIYCNGERVNSVSMKPTRFQIEGLVSGVTYVYQVSAVDISGNESNRSASVTVQIDNVAPVITMSPLHSILSAKPVTLTYTVSDDIDLQPQITANYASGAEFNRDGTYDVSVAAVDDHANRAEKAIRIIVESGAPEKVILSATDAAVGQTVSLDWKGYDETPDVVSYSIYRGVTAFTSIECMTPVAIIPRETFHYQIAGLINGKRYYFAVVAVDNLGNVNKSVNSVLAIPTGGKGVLEIVSIPDTLQTRVYLGGTYGYQGIYQGQTPVTITGLNVGKYVLQAKAPGYETYYTIVEVTPDDSSHITGELQPSKSFGYTTSKLIQASDSDLNFGCPAKPVIADWNKDGKKDLIGIDSNHSIVVYFNNGSNSQPVFTIAEVLVENLEDCFNFSIADYNNDFSNDLIIGKSNGGVEVLFNEGTDDQPEFSGPVVSLAIQVCGNASPAVVDWNGDTAKDFLIGDGSGSVKVFINTGTDAAPVFSEEPSVTPILLGSGNAAVSVVDWNRDGLMDIVTGEASGCLKLFINTGAPENPSFGSASPINAQGSPLCLSSETAPFIIDWNDDGLKDFIVGSGEGTVFLYQAVTNVPPIADAGFNQSILSQNISSTTINGTVSDENKDDVLTYRWRIDEIIPCDWRQVSLQNQCPLSLNGISLPVGSHVMVLEASDGQATSTDEMVLNIENSNPTVVAEGSGVYEIQTPITLGGMVADYDGDALTYQWFEGEGLLGEGVVHPNIFGEPLMLPQQVINNLPIGVHELSLKISDGINPAVSSSVRIEIVDTTVPTLSPQANVTMLWPPNHRMVEIVIMAKARDNSGSVRLSAAVSSDEPQDEFGDGDETPDWNEPMINQETGQITLQLRAERSGKGNGRAYTIRIFVSDNSNNISSADVRVVVPHNK
ncbi:MAG: VCBS repeat-containing protein [Chitinivibrionales bacterium]|nr:VCBS repeat-containing protein [Chitinivibrionales bacterium]